MEMLWGADRSKDTPRCAPYPSAHGEKAGSCTAKAVGHRGAAPSAVLEGRLPRAADIIAAYRPYFEAVLAHYAGRALPLREVERIRLSRGLRELGTCRIRRADDAHCVLSFSRHLFFPGNEENLVSVVCHEMLHACLPYGEGHGTHFRFFMRKLNEALGLSIAVHSAETTIRPNAARYRYRVTCGACGNAFCYLRAGAIVRHPGRYRCARCGASSFTVETLR
ncbi:MAG: SprT-like domain-containing protein [Schwartzia sp. (in: firmicutes)]